MQTRAVHALSVLLACIRFDEVLILQGSPLLGALYAMPAPRLAAWRPLLLLAAGGVSLVAHIFVLNDWAGMEGDLRDPNRASSVFSRRGIARKTAGFLWIALLAMSLALLAPLGIRTLVISTAIAGLSALYSFPGAHMKGVPVLNSLLHFTGGLLHFLLGYSVFRELDARGAAIGCFFALVFVAGHLVHETRDSEPDLANGISTNAVRFGQRRSFIAGMVSFTVADALLAVLAMAGVVPRVLVLIVPASLIRLYWSVKTLRAGLRFANIRWLQARYRLLYAVVGAVMALTMLAGF